MGGNHWRRQNASDKAIVVVLFILTLAYLWLFRRPTTMDPDEGIVPASQERILQGEFALPGFLLFLYSSSYYLLFLLFKVFGNLILVGRTALVIFGGVYSVITYLWRDGPVRPGVRWPWRES